MTVFWTSNTGANVATFLRSQSVNLLEDGGLGGKTEWRYQPLVGAQFSWIGSMPIAIN